MFRNRQSLPAKILDLKETTNNQSFTIIEMIVVLSITVFLAALLTANMRSGGDSMDLTSEAQKLAGVIRQAQMMALTGKQIELSRQKYGYGVYVDSTSYVLFANDFDGASYLYNDGDDTIIQSFSFPDNIEMTSPTDPFSVIFTPPLAEMHSSIGIGFSLNVVLTNTLINLNKFLRITSYGEVDIF